MGLQQDLLLSLMRARRQPHIASATLAHRVLQRGHHRRGRAQSTTELLEVATVQGPLAAREVEALEEPEDTQEIQPMHPYAKTYVATEDNGFQSKSIQALHLYMDPHDT